MISTIEAIKSKAHTVLVLRVLGSSFDLLSLISALSLAPRIESFTSEAFTFAFSAVVVGVVVGAVVSTPKASDVVWFVGYRF